MTPEPAPVADPPLPRGLVVAALTALGVAALYWLAYQELGAIPTGLVRYQAERAAALDTDAPVTDASLTELAADPLAVAAGERAFAATCARCHGGRAEGNVGPNLTDAYWIGGGAPLAIYATIREGRPTKGMPAWGGELGRATCKELAAYVLSLRGLDLPGKAPQGERWYPGPAR